MDEKMTLKRRIKCEVQKWMDKKDELKKDWWKNVKYKKDGWKNWNKKKGGDIMDGNMT